LKKDLTEERRRQRNDQNKGRYLSMGLNLSKDWPVYVLLSFAAFFFIYVIVRGNLDARNNKKNEDKEKAGEKR